MSDWQVGKSGKDWGIIKPIPNKHLKWQEKPPVKKENLTKQFDYADTHFSATAVPEMGHISVEELNDVFGLENKQIMEEVEPGYYGSIDDSEKYEGSIGVHEVESALDNQVGGEHYKELGMYQPWEVLQAWLTEEEFRGYMKGTAIAYLAREAKKGGDQDIEKAIHTLQGLMELQEDFE